MVSKIQGTYNFTAPVDFQLGFIVNALAGGRWQPFERFTEWFLPDGTTGQLRPVRSLTPAIEERGSRARRTTSSASTCGSTSASRCAAPGVIWAWCFDIFNVFNDDTVINFEDRIDRDTYLDPERIIQPRIFRLGARWIF